jgi:predicted Fe-S protein YdhL (DUF1289 family)
MSCKNCGVKIYFCCCCRRWHHEISNWLCIKAEPDYSIKNDLKTELEKALKENREITVQFKK